MWGAGPALPSWLWFCLTLRRVLKIPLSISIVPFCFSDLIIKLYNLITLEGICKLHIKFNANFPRRVSKSVKFDVAIKWPRTSWPWYHWPPLIRTASLKFLWKISLEEKKILFKWLDCAVAAWWLRPWGGRLVGWWGFHETQHEDVSPATLYCTFRLLYVKGSYDVCHVTLSL